ncbi:structural maintenance of chromosomes protein 2-like [Uloborus diversus]|uniref:structural maintenance of chromosomes protein 2-like n=1 Tax=Uloborus diversus TaxID=327109 RepID=UPI00240941E9|nr:structural maintenance of chromosomes protein 2-like [Uloborus diversus]
MYVKTITLEGFKSYGVKTVIDGFDPSFNAITGLNGSGKSNILDSICFVLGITNLSQVRATSLTELVYKNGQAGINKATVTITFDNRDKDSSPIGYAAVNEISVTRIVVTGGKNKYLINGVTATNARVHDLFQSVQLNVNNPHFLIMQGRITKVLNMKPIEILSMIEEAAGTRMYEDKREASLKSLEKKETKLREINTMLTEHICPQLERLKEERKEYTEYTRVVREHEKLSKIFIAWDYTQTEEIIAKSAEEENKLQENFNNLKTSIKEMKKSIEECDSKMKDIEQKMSMEGGQKLAALESELKPIELKEVQIEAKYKSTQTALKEEEKRKTELIRNLKEEKNLLVQKEGQLEKSEKKLQELKVAMEADEEEKAAAESHLHAVLAGSNDMKGKETSLAAQLIAAGKERKDSETEAKSLQMSLKHLKVEIEKKKAELKKVDKSYTNDQATYQALSKEVKRLKDEVSALEAKATSYESLVQQEKKMSYEISRFKDELDYIFTRFPQLNFDFTDPVKNFNRAKVSGPVCLQLELKDPKDSVALDVAAGRKLYNVIVDDEETGKLILTKGQLANRSTLIPLNKIQGYPIENRIVQNAENLVGKNNVATAISRVIFEKKFTPAMEFVFGGTFICPDMEPAKKVTFAENIRKRSVTLDGSVFDPSGTLSGGSMGNRGQLLTELAPIPGKRKKLNTMQNQLTQLQMEIQSLRKIRERYDTLVEQLELKENEVELLKSRIEHSSYNKQIEELKSMEKSFEEQNLRLAECQQKQKNAEILMKELDKKTAKSMYEEQYKQAQKALDVVKGKVAASVKKHKALNDEVSVLKGDMESMTKSISTTEEQIEEHSKNVTELEKKLQEIDEERKLIKETVSAKSEEIKSQKAILRGHNNDLSKINKEKEGFLKKIGNAELQMQQMEHDIKICGSDVVEAKKKKKYLLDKHKWIEGQVKYFGTPNSEYDFKSLNPKAAASQIKELEELKEKLQKNVNTRAQNMLGEVEEQYKKLMTRREEVMEDKKSIQLMIEQLDAKKKSAVIHACEKVNKDFGSIFRTLLPGTDAVLKSLPGKTPLDGLEFKVSFGGVVKESLNELSGGQRSLVALSLILALLLFKPAPIYILDEVDAALDLSHTQNIGKMLRMHFTKSQFIIVSLKDGMFSNANVLFQTKFSDGMSTVSRTAQRQGKS